MNLITEIIQNLSSDDPDLTNALVKTKVLLHKLGQKELADSWVNKELSGYGDDDELPEYRILNSTPKCNYMSQWYEGTNQPLPLGNFLNEQQRDGLRHYRIGSSISAIESTITGNPGGSDVITAGIPPEIYHKLSEVFTRGVNITNAWVEMGIHQYLGLLTEVRSRLLDFVLNLQDEFGEESSNDEIQQQATKVDTKGMFHNAIHSGGGDITITIGDNSTVQVNKGDFESLAGALLEIGIEQKYIDNLKDCIKEDDTGENQQSGEKVDGWCKGMYERIIEGAWGIEMRVAASVITDALKKFYGGE